MPIRTIQTHEQVAVLLAAYPIATSRIDWTIGYTANWDTASCSILDRLCSPGPAARRALERWWAVEPVNLP